MRLSRVRWPTLNAGSKRGATVGRRSGRGQGRLAERARLVGAVDQLTDVGGALAALRLTVQPAIHAADGPAALGHEGADLAVGDRIADADIHECTVRVSREIKNQSQRKI